MACPHLANSLRCQTTASTRFRTLLDDIAEELAEIGLAMLRDAIQTESSSAAATERRLTRARRAVLKAAALLAGAGDGDDDG